MPKIFRQFVVLHKGSLCYSVVVAAKSHFHQHAPHRHFSCCEKSVNSQRVAECTLEGLLFGYILKLAIIPVKLLQTINYFKSSIYCVHQLIKMCILQKSVTARSKSWELVAAVVVEVTNR